MDSTAKFSDFGTAAQGSPYGAPTVTTTSTIPVSAGKPHKEINWGGVMKGVAIVAAVAVAAVAVGFLAQAAVIGVGNAIALNSSASALAVTAGSGVATVANGLLTAAQYLVDVVAALPGAIVKFFGLTGTAAQVTAGAATVAPMVGVISAGAVGAAAAGHAIPALGNIDYTQTVSGTTAAAMQSSHAVHATHAMAEMAHMSHHAAEHTSHSSWTDRFTSRGGAAANFADTVASRKPIDIAPRDGNFAAQVDADTAKLNHELGK